IRRRGLPRAPLEAMIEGRYRELDARPMELAEALDWARDTGGGAATVAALVLDLEADLAKAEAGGSGWAIGRLMGTAGLAGPEAERALADALSAARGLSAGAFPAVAHATLARRRAKGRRPGPLEARLRVFWAVLRGAV
ncbi:MAG TPA: hypothetical protein VFW47_17255, partial [Phenylobacterium sp.]|nr:hypothetical protein [Phenylobacterium sp.]